MISDFPAPSQISGLRNLWQEAFGDDDAFLDSFFSTGFSPKRCRGIFGGDTATAALYWFDCRWNGKPVAYIYAVATAKAFQGQGLCRALMEETHKLLAELGYHGAVLVPGSDSLFKMYQGMGYRSMPGIREFSCEASHSPAAVRKIAKDEYAALRRQLLPSGGILQEEENLDFLQEMLTLWAGENCVFCAREEDGHLTVPELLGDAAPGDIVAAFGCKKGTFRAPNGQQPFAMYRRLTEDNQIPEYFGLAFD